MLHVTDSGYPGSPISGLASHQSQVWPGPGQEMGQSIDLARRELAGLIRDQGRPGTTASLPSFPDIFSPQGPHGHLSTDDLDDLDKEITEIVEAATCRVPIHVEAAEAADTCHRPQPIRTGAILLSPEARDSPDQVMVAVVRTAAHAFNQGEDMIVTLHTSSKTSIMHR